MKAKDGWNAGRIGGHNILHIQSVRNLKDIAVVVRGQSIFLVRADAYTPVRAKDAPPVVTGIKTSQELSIF